MCDDDNNQGLSFDARLSRRNFGLVAAAAMGAVAAPAFAAGVVEKDVDVKMADGVADSALFYPEGKGTWPAVLLWTDIAGLRPAFRDMGRRLAAEGYVVLVPNVYYRTRKAPVVGATFNSATDRAQLPPRPDDAAIDRDAVAYIAFLDAQSQTNTKKKVGVQGYCMGGPLSFHTASAVPGRIGAVATFHGGGLVTATPASPALLVAKTKAEYLCCVAQNDDKTDPAAKDKLNAAFDEAKLKHHVEVYHADHGWTVKGSAVYNEGEAERAWAALLPLYKRALV